jgi:hypothetical protein
MKFLIKKSQIFLAVIFFQFFVIKTLGPDAGSGSGSMNPDPKHCTVPQNNQTSLRKDKLKKAKIARNKKQTNHLQKAFFGAIKAERSEDFYCVYN